jgi:hypothetical protein
MIGEILGELMQGGFSELLREEEEIHAAAKLKSQREFLFHARRTRTRISFFTLGGFFFFWEASFPLIKTYFYGA